MRTIPRVYNRFQVYVDYVGRKPEPPSSAGNIVHRVTSSALLGNS